MPELRASIVFCDAIAFADRTPPREIRLFKAGENASTKGPFLFDDKAAAAVMSVYAQMGRRVTWDYHHGAVQENPVDPSKAGKASGVCDLEVRAGELWATNITWTPEASAGIANGEWLYFSPAFERDKTGRPLWLINVALENNPALFGLDELIAATALRAAGLLDEATTPVQLGAVSFRGFPLATSGSWDADAATMRLRKWASKDGSGDSNTVDSSKYREGFTFVDDAESGFGAFKLPHHDLNEHGELVTSRAGVIAAAGAISGARGGVKIPDADMAAVKAHIESHYRQWGGTAPWIKRPPQTEKATAMSVKYSDVPAFLKKSGNSKASCAKAFDMSATELDDAMSGDESMTATHAAAFKKMQADAADDDDDDSGAQMKAKAKAGVSLIALGAVLGVPRTTEEDALALVADHRHAVTELCSATGTKSVDNALAIVKALVAKKTEYEALAADAKSVKVESLLKDARAARKITPAEIEGEHGLRAIGLENPERLDAMLKGRTPIELLSGTQTTTASVVTEPETQLSTEVSTTNLSGAPVTFNGKAYEELPGDVKHNLKMSANPSERAMFAKLHADAVRRGKAANLMGFNGGVTLEKALTR